MRIIIFFLLLSFSPITYGQFAIMPYKLVRDSLTHISVFHSGNAERIRLSSDQYSDTLSLISPDVKLKNGIVDHKSLTGEMLVREYYNDSTLIGYIEFSGPFIQREIYFDLNSIVFLEKRYEKGVPIYYNSEMRTYLRKSTCP